MSKGLWPWGLKLGGGRGVVDRANVEYTGKLSPVPAEMQYGGALEFDGVDDYIDTAAVLSDGDDYTLCVTVSLSALAEARTLHNYYGFNAITTSSRLKCLVMLKDSGATSLSGNVPLTTSSVYRLILVAKSGEFIKGYVNAVLDVDEIIAEELDKLDNPFLVSSGTNKQFKGIIANAQVWNKAFTQEDVTYDFANQSTTADTREGTGESEGTDLTRANLVGHWRLDEKWGTVANDSSDYGNDGTLVGFGSREYPRLLDKGKKPKDDAVIYSGQMLDFDGVDDEIPTAALLSNGGDFTVCATFMASDLSGYQGIALHYGNSGGLALNSSGVLFAHVRSADTNPYLMGPELTAGVLYRGVLSVQSEGAIALYLDGAVVASGVLANGDTTEFLSTKVLKIGAYANSTYFFNGQIGNVQIWDKALTAEEVAADYTNPENVDTSNPHLKGWWPLIEGSGDTAYDWSGNSNHGTLTNFDTTTCWEAGKALSNPRVLQTALMEWGMGSNNLETTDITDSDIWYKEYIGVTSGETAPDGTSTAYKLTISGTNQAFLSSNNACVAGNQKSLWAKTVSGVATVKLLGHNSDSGTPLTILTETWTRYKINYDDQSTNPQHFYVVDFRGSDTTNADIIIWSPQNELSALTSATTITHSSPATNALVPIRDWETAGQFTRDYNELNWNGRSYANCGNGPDVNPSSALVIECALRTNYAGNTKYWVGATKNFKGYVQYGGIKFYVITPDDTQYLGSGYSDADGSLKHLVIIFSASNQRLIGYENGILKLTKFYSSNANISPSSSNLILLEDGLDAQLPLFRMYIDEDAQKIIDGDLDAWVAKRYNKFYSTYLHPLPSYWLKGIEQKVENVAPYELHSGQMLDFDGVDDYVALDSSINDGSSWEGVTVAFTTDLESFNAGCYFATSYQGDNRGIKIFQHWAGTTTRKLYIRMGDGGLITTVNPIVTLGLQRVIISYDGVNYKIYTDGELVETYESSGAISLRNDSPAAIGAKYDGSGQYIDGQIGNVQIWNKAFTAEEVAADYANPENVDTSDPHLKGWWPLIEGSGDTAYDWSDNGNHGTLTNFDNATCWDAGKALSNPRVLQTAYMEWGIGSNLCVPTDITQARGQFITWTTDGTLTLSGSLANLGTGADGEGALAYYDVTVTPETEYTLSAIVKEKDLDGQSFKFRVYDVTNGVNLGYFTQNVTQDWTIVSHTFVTPTDCTRMYLYPYYISVGGGASPAIYVDAPQFNLGNTRSATTITHANPATNALTPIRDWETAGQFTRDYNELNWNGRSYANCGNGPDVNPSTAVVIEMVVTLMDTMPGYVSFLAKNINCFRVFTFPDSYSLGCKLFSDTTNAVSETCATGGEIQHIIFTYDTTSHLIRTFMSGVKIGNGVSLSGSMIAQTTGDLILGGRDSVTHRKGQLPLFRMYTNEEAQKIIDHNLDAWVTKRYAEAQTMYGV